MTLLYVDIIYTVSIIKVNDNPSKITICQTSKTYLISSIKGASHWQRILKNRTRVDPKTNCGFKSSIQEEFNNKLEGLIQTTHILLQE